MKLEKLKLSDVVHVLSKHEMKGIGGGSCNINCYRLNEGGSYGEFSGVCSAELAIAWMSFWDAAGYSVRCYG